MQFTFERTQDYIEMLLKLALEEHYKVHSVYIRGRKQNDGRLLLQATATITNRRNDTSVVTIGHDDIMLVLVRKLSERGYEIDKFVGEPAITGSADSTSLGAKYSGIVVTYVYEDGVSMTKKRSGKTKSA